MLQLQNSFGVSPAFLELHAPEPRPVLALSNPYDSELAGTIEVQTPATWQVRQRPTSRRLPPWAMNSGPWQAAQFSWRTTSRGVSVVAVPRSTSFSALAAS